MVLEEMNFCYNCGYLKETHLITLDDKYKIIIIIIIIIIPCGLLISLLLCASHIYRETA